ncbi:MAG: TadE/TadG family type IV pilus assembly protein [Micrococcales bacterium]
MTLLLRLIRSDRGAVTAEFVMVLPVVIMVLGITLNALALQLERMKLVSVAATISRAIARGEPQEKVLPLLGGNHLVFKNTEDLICAEVSASYRLLGWELPISDLECARRLGL